MVEVIVTFILGAIIFFFLKHRKINVQENVSYVLFGTFKNGSSAAALSLLLISPAALIPMAIRGIATPFYLIFLGWMFRKYEPKVTAESDE